MSKKWGFDYVPRVRFRIIYLICKINRSNGRAGFRPEAPAWINVLAVLGTAQMKLLVKVSSKKKRNDNQLVVTTVNKMGGPSRPTYQDTFQTISIISRKCLTFPVSLCANNEILISLKICINNELQFEHRGKVIVTQREHLVSLRKTSSMIENRRCGWVLPQRQISIKHT